MVDPEDDLTPVGYPSDFGTATTATTIIPPYDPGSTGVPGYGALDHQEPLPYVQSQASGRYFATEPTAIGLGSGVEDDDRLGVVGRRGTQYLGLLILRVGLGVALGAHGLQKLFGWWSGQGLTGLKNSLADIGYRHADILAYVHAGGEIVIGALLIVGLLTPLAAAGALALLTNDLFASISAQHSGSFLYFLPDGHEYHISLIVMVIAVILTGPGRYSFDGGRGWAYRPFIGSFVALLGGIAAGVAIWVLLNGANPLA